MFRVPHMNGPWRFASLILSPRIPPLVESWGDEALGIDGGDLLYMLGGGGFYPTKGSW